MLYTSRLINAINESSTGSFRCYGTREFYGSMDEMTSEFGFSLMSEAADIASFIAETDEIMTEAAISNPSSVVALSENVLENLKKKVKNIFTHLLEMIKGIIAKLKAFFLAFRKKNGEWVKTMSPYITKASKEKNASNVIVSVHTWDHEYLTGGLLDAINNLMDEITKDEDDFNTTIEDANKTLNSLGSFDFSKEVKAEDLTDEKVKPAIESLEVMAEKCNRSSEEFTEGAWEHAAKVLGVEGSYSSPEAVWAAVSKKAAGGDKIDTKIGSIKCASGSGPSGMMTFIEKSNETINALVTAYDKHKSTLESMSTKVTTTLDKSKLSDNDKLPGEFLTAYNSVITAACNFILKPITIVENIINTTRAKNQSYIETAVKEYMSALSKFANYKAPKE